jgi:hypothetical protein
MGGIYVGKSMDIALGRVVAVRLGAPQNIKKVIYFYIFF